MEKNVCRIAVFYDGTYFSKVSDYYMYQHERKARVSINGLHEFIVAEVGKQEGVDARHCQIVDASYFRGRFTAQQAQEKDKLYSERVFEDVLMRAHITLHQHHLKTRPDGSYEEKQIDVWLALEAYEMASLKKYDVCVLISGDGDFVPLVRKLNTLGSRVMLLGWDFTYERDGRTFRTQVSTDLIDCANYPTMMDKVIDARERRTDPLINNLFLPRTAEFMPPRAPVPKDVPANDEPIGVEMRGSVLAPNVEKGFVFIKPTGGGENYFCPARELTNVAIEELRIGSSVRFTSGRNEKGPAAYDVFVETGRGAA